MRYATIDIETTGLNRYKDKITWIGVGLAQDTNSDISKMFIYDADSPKDIHKFKNLVNNLHKHKVKTVFRMASLIPCSSRKP